MRLFGSRGAPKAVVVKPAAQTTTKSASNSSTSSDSETRDEEKNTPLHSAAEIGNLENVALLVEKGSNVTAVNKYGLTPLHNAARNGHVEVARYLLKRGCEVEPKNMDGKTPLHYACDKNKLDVVRILVIAGSKISEPDREGTMPIHYACGGGHLEMVKFLFSQGALIASVAKYGNTPLIVAAQCGHFEIVQFLVKKGVDVTATNKHGATALHLASQWGHFTVVQCLVEHGYCVTVQDKDGRSPIDVARTEEISLYLRNAEELQKQGEVLVKRATVILVGGGTTGKTTLVHCLKESSFSQDSLTMTDGIEMHHLALGGIDFTIMDFAGQKEYFHTHNIFFKSTAIYLAFFMPRSGASYKELECFLQMVKDCAPSAPVILVTTRSDEAVLSADDENVLKGRHPYLRDIVAIDCKSGSGISALKELLVSTALQQTHTERKVPAQFFKLEQNLFEIAESGCFSLTAAEYFEIATEKYELSEVSSYLARDLFNSWGAVHVLSNGEVVLRPQLLADVLACVITKKTETLSRIGYARDGLLKHDEDSLCAIWKEYPRHLWHCGTDTSTSSPSSSSSSPSASSSFLDLLHQSNLAYPLYGPDGHPLRASLVVAMLPDKPDGYTDSDITNQSLCKLFKDDGSHECLCVVFLQIPSTFMCHLQVRLKSYVTIGGGWRHGCRIVVKGKAGTKDSYAVVYEKENSMYVLSSGNGNTARSTVLITMLSVMRVSHPTLEVKDYILSHDLCKGRVWDREELEEAVVAPGYVEFKKVKIPVQSLDILFNTLERRIKVMEVEMENMPVPAAAACGGNCGGKEKGGSVRGTEREQAVLKRPAAHREGGIEKLPASLAALQSLLLTADTVDTDDIDISISLQLQECIPDILCLLKVKRSNRNSLNTLWIVTENNLAELAVLPFSPGISPSDRWFPIDSAAVPLLADHDNLGSETDSDLSLRVTVTDLLKRTMNQLGILLPKGWGMSTQRDCSKCEDDCRREESKHFATLDGQKVFKENVAIMRCMEVSANYTVLASRITNGFTLLRQDLQDSSKSVIRELNSVGNTVISEIVSVKDMIISLHDKMDILMSAQADTSILIRQVALDAKTNLREFKNSLNALQVSLSKSFEGLESMGPASTEDMKKAVSLAVQSAMTDVTQGGLDKSIQEAMSNTIKGCDPSSVESGDEDVREQLKSMARILIEMKEDIKRAASDMSAVRADLMTVNQALGAHTLMIQTLLNSKQNMPTLMLIVPSEPKGYFQKAKTLFQNEVCIFFICPVTKIPAKSGPDGKGYRVKVTKEWVRKAAPVLVITLKIVQLAMTAYGIPFPLPTLPFDLSAAAFLGMVSSEIDSQFNTTMGITKQEVTAKQQEESRVLEAYANVKEALSIAQDDVPKSKVKLKSMGMYVEEGTDFAYQAVKDLLVSLEKPKSGSDSAWKPQHTGLEMVTAGDGSTAWVSQEGMARFLEEGKGALV